MPNEVDLANPEIFNPSNVEYKFLQLCFSVAY